MNIKVLIIMIMFSGSVFSTVNTEKIRLGLSEPGIAGTLNLTYSVISGNSELTSIGLGPNLVWRTGRHQLFTLNNLTRVSSDGGSIINKGFSHLRYNYEITDRFIYELFLQAQYDKSQDLEQRYLAGTGIRILAIKRGNCLMANGIAGMYEYEELSTGEISRPIRGSLYLTLNYGKSHKISITNTIYIQPAIDDIDDYRILNEGELKVDITGYFALTTSIQYRYDSKPPADIKNYDLGINNGLEFSF